MYDIPWHTYCPKNRVNMLKAHYGDTWWKYIIDLNHKKTKMFKTAKQLKGNEEVEEDDSA